MRRGVNSLHSRTGKGTNHGDPVRWQNTASGPGSKLRSTWLRLQLRHSVSGASGEAALAGAGSGVPPGHFQSNRKSDTVYLLSARLTDSYGRGTLRGCTPVARASAPLAQTNFWLRW